MALYGLGGIGKTQVALQLARWVKVHIPDCSVFWAPAISVENLSKRSCKLRKSLECRKLQMMEIPRNYEQGITLLTTRSYDVAMSFAGTDVFELQRMTPEEGMAFLAKIAAYYISRNKGTTIRYLELMHKTEQDRVRLAKRDFHDSTRYRKTPNAVATTWLISFNQINGSDPLAADLLEFMSYLQSKAIPRSLLPLDSEEDMDFAIGTLCSYGFLTRRDEEVMFDMHSLVQLSTRVWIAEAKKTQQIVATVTQQINKCFPSHEYANRGVWRKYLPHALEILGKEESKDLRDRYRLLSKAGQCIFADGRAKEAVPY
ncbi:hypothetical protein N7493_005357 [Penicillium malachiteum]|uniref:Uncharacterized protein n=1 Tax=Penicillium malachiteum TaxID=1324776 RepID=A0AAD6HMU6_9EURO|nr:hypothetical protein N7493_005357 [Penicillium malachiteum]